MTQLDLETSVRRWEDQRAIKNLMGKYVLSILLEQREQAFARFWSKRDDVCLGFNDGWYAGAQAVSGWYQAGARRTAAESELMKELFPDKLGQLSPEALYGAGHLDNRPVSAPVIRVAGDGETAKGMWTSMGCYNAFEPEFGPQSHWNWSVYAADFVREDGEWKIWHLQYLTEIDVRCGTDWSKPAPAPVPRPEFAPLKEFSLPAPNVPAQLHQPWSEKRLRMELPPLPAAYEHFSDTFSYGWEGTV